MVFLNYREGGTVFYQVFLLSSLQCTVTELWKGNCKRLREFKKLKSQGKKEKYQGKAVEETVNSKEETLEIFVRIGSKNSTSGLLQSSQ